MRSSAAGDCRAFVSFHRDVAIRPNGPFRGEGLWSVGYATLPCRGQLGGLAPENVVQIGGESRGTNAD